MVTISIVKQIKKYISFRFILEFKCRYNLQQKFFPFYHIFLFCSHFVLLFVDEWVLPNFRLKWQSRLWIVLPPTPCSPHKICHNKLQVTGEWLRWRVIGLGTPRFLGHLFISSPYVCDEWFIFAWVGWWHAYHEMVISACALRRWWFIASSGCCSWLSEAASFGQTLKWLCSRAGVSAGDHTPLWGNVERLDCFVCTVPSLWINGRFSQSHLKESFHLVFNLMWPKGKSRASLPV